MNHPHSNGQLTFGALVADTYGACERRRATALIRFAVNAGVLSLPRAYSGARARSARETASPAPEPVATGVSGPTAKASGAVCV